MERVRERGLHFCLLKIVANPTSTLGKKMSFPSFFLATFSWKEQGYLNRFGTLKELEQSHNILLEDVQSPHWSWELLPQEQPVVSDSMVWVLG